MGKQEAKIVAQEVLELLLKTEKELKSARNWGIYDLLGGGSLSSWIKLGKVDKAEKQLHEIQNKLLQLQRELGELPLELDAKIDISGFQRFMDIVFDHIIVDWLTQTKIKESLKEVSGLIAEIRKIELALEQMDAK